MRLETTFQGVAALVAVSFAILLWSTRGSGRSQRILGVFLLCIATNQLGEFARAFATTQEQREIFYRIGAIGATMDPAALAWFASTLPDARLFRRPVAVYGILAICGATTLAVAWWPEHLEPGWFGIAAVIPVLVTVYTVLTYLALLFDRLEPALAEPRWGPSSFALTAYAFAALPLPSLQGEVLFGPLFRGASYEQMGVLVAALEAVTLVALAGGILLAARRFPSEPGARARVVVALFATACLWAVLDAYHLARAVSFLAGGGDPLSLQVVGQSATAARWLLFSACISVAIVRSDPLALTLRERRRAARVLLALGVVALSAIVLSITGGGLRALDILLIVIVVILAQGFRHSIDRLAWRVYEVPVRDDLAAREEAYRRAALEASARGRIPSQDAALQQLRVELDLDPMRAASLERDGALGASAPIAIGQIVAARYQVERFISRRGGARTFLAHDELLDRKVALKELVFDTHEAQSNALVEARNAARIRSPRVLALHDVLQRRRSIVLVTELAEGGTLAEGAPHLTPDERVTIVGEILEGVALMHESNIVHGGLDPASVQLTASRHAKIADFGLARVVTGDTAVLASGALLLPGSGEFVAPEVRAGGRARFPSDVYSAAAVARWLAPELPAPLDAVLQRALLVDPAERWTSGGEMLRAWRRAMEPVSPRGPG